MNSHTEGPLQSIYIIYHITYLYIFSVVNLTVSEMSYNPEVEGTFDPDLEAGRQHAFDLAL